MKTINKNEVLEIVKNLMESDKLPDKSGLSYLIGVNKEVDKYLINHEKTPQSMKDEILNNKMQNANSLMETNKEMVEDNFDFDR